MKHHNKRNNNNNEADQTGDIMIWVIIFILMFAFPPVGLVLLILKIRSYAKPSNNTKSAPGARTSNTKNQSHSQFGTAASQTVHKAAATAQTAKANTTRPHAHNTSTAKPGKFTDHKQLKSKSAVAIPIILLLISIALFILGATTMIGAAVDIFGAAGLSRWLEFWMGAFYFSGGFIALISRNIFTKRFGRYRNYFAYIADKNIIPLANIAQTAGVSVKTAKRDIQTMINSGYFEFGSYIDNELESLVLCSEAAEEFRKSARPFNSDVTDAPEVSPNQYMAIMTELRETRLAIADITISEKIEKIEEITAKIFRTVEEHPEKKKQIRRFESYYLPTTMKLVRSYTTLEKQGVKGEHIMSAKENIEQVLDTLATGYEQQLDQLFKSDAMDIAADITVLENLMHQDGLKGDHPDFKTMTG
ncbi:MAG: 5-bromo-4-chloroindolyl phosphate hydrolysis family protein [Oscillospiraceae bacterium]|nr:5-bromo-4-chloroindolyl phosphate hydrolysis family protein [Oscillospiraceae bacterium]